MFATMKYSQSINRCHDFSFDQSFGIENVSNQILLYLSYHINEIIN